jgi:alpha-L-fucosidase 2
MRSIQNRLFHPVLIIIFLLAACRESGYIKLQPDMHVWYEQPAAEWVEALPVGNGRLGAMVFGRPYRERIQLNEESIWAGAPLDNNNPEALANLPRLRQLLFDYRVEEAQELVARHFIGTPPRIRSYQTAGDLFLSMDSLAPYRNYRRELCLETGVASTTFEINDIIYTREIFASAPANALIIRLTSSKKHSLDLAISMEREKDALTGAMEGGYLVMRGQVNDEDSPLQGPGGMHMKFASAVRVLTDGEIITGEGSLEVNKAGNITVIYTAATNYDPDKLGFREDIDPLKDCLEIIGSLDGKSYREIRNSHVNDHAALFNRVIMDLGGKEATQTATDKRLEKVKNGARDHHLAATLFQYGRYLLMGSSRFPGILPANLQGVWNNHFNAPWNSDFHTNINLQMNYWPAEITGLPETVMPLTRFLTRLTVPGSKTASQMYDAKGWTLHHLTDPFGRTGVMDGPWGLTPMCGPWMTFPVWRHFAFSLDTAYLRDHAYPLLKGSAMFILDFLVESPEGYLVTNPSHSPENTYFLPSTEKRVTLTYGATMDIQIARAVLENTIQASEILETDKEFRAMCKKSLDRLPPVRTGQDGTIMEWIEDYSEPEPGHRHISHLLGLYPLHQITPDDPVTFTAASRTIEKRLAHGGGHTGWSRAWIINFFNRLGNSEKSYENLMTALRTTTLTNLFSTHPPFQIDGNFGATAGIAGMLLDSSPGTITLLPALPREWGRGSVHGLRAYGGITVSISWENGILNKADIHAFNAGTAIIRYGDRTLEWDAEPGRHITLNNRLEIID